MVADRAGLAAGAVARAGLAVVVAVEVAVVAAWDLAEAAAAGWG